MSKKINHPKKLRPSVLYKPSPKCVLYKPRELKSTKEVGLSFPDKGSTLLHSIIMLKW